MVARPRLHCSYCDALDPRVALARDREGVLCQLGELGLEEVLHRAPGVRGGGVVRVLAALGVVGAVGVSDPGGALEYHEIRDAIPGVGVLDELALAAHDQRSVLLEHAEDGAAAWPAIEPEHDGLVVRLRALRRCEPVVQLRPGPSVEEAGGVRRRPAAAREAPCCTQQPAAVIIGLTVWEKFYSRRAVVREACDAISGREGRRKANKARQAQQAGGQHHNGVRAMFWFCGGKVTEPHHFPACS
jgi:hypothetical protein